MTRLATLTRTAALAFLLLAALAGRPALAHFPWLALDDQRRALLFFGEGPQDRTYKLPEAVAKTKVSARAPDGARTELQLQPVDEEQFVGLRSAEPVGENVALEATCRYGLYHGMLLTYYAQHFPNGPDAWERHAKSSKLPLQITPSCGEAGLALTATWKGEPTGGAIIAVVDSKGEQHEAETTEDGKALFADLPAGPVGVTVSVTEDVAGELEGKKYESVGHYATLTFNYPGSVPPGNAPTGDDRTAGKYPPLPEPVASFGGAVADGYLYVYSGHVGQEHEHSRENLSQHFRRLKLNGGRGWEELPMQTPLQGMPLVAHGGKVYRVGGLSARNAPGEEEDLHSVAEFACFDPRSRRWTELPPLPEGRSSHDAVVIGDRLCVAGGWTLVGDAKGVWLDTAWSIDLDDPQAAWKPLAGPPFRRRALALGHWQGRLIAVGGITDKREISRSVDMLDLGTGTWTKAADLPGEGMDGFGVSVWNQGDRLFASGTQDSLYVLSDDGSKWTAAGALQQPRFFHRLLPGSAGRLLAVGGAAETGHLADIEELAPQLNGGPER
ncbi:MAG: hypothetical protein DCC67_08380 [Planctomycetota bacterium]|nr:MAG: hypothetical protein DCC67_08380 [Planctomycetota bacterium]